MLRIIMYFVQINFMFNCQTSNNEVSNIQGKVCKRIEFREIKSLDWRAYSLFADNLSHYSVGNND